MKTNNIKIFSLSTLLVLFFTLNACSGDLLDTNENPNVATDIDPDYLFGYATLAWSGARTGGDLFLPVGFANQSLATGGNTGWGYGEDRYDISPYSIGNTWRFYFVNGGNNLTLAIDKAESAVPVNNNAAAQCKIILANTIYEATMIYGDIPYRQAWSPEYPNPEFDSQEQVLNDLIDLLDEAINQIDVSSILKIESNDAYYKGDMNKWIKYAKSLKFKILMTMVDKASDKASLIGTLVDDNLVSASSDNLMMPFYDETNAENPKFKLFKKYAGSANPWIFANSNVFSFMEERADPRISKYFDANDKGFYAAIETATEANDDDTSDDATSPISLDGLWKVDAPDLILSCQEILLLKAEVYARGLGKSVDLSMANTLYKEGVKQSLLYYGVDEAEADTYVESELADISGLSQAEAIYEIHVQQWIDLMDRSLEGWIQSRRSGNDGNEVPNLKIPEGAPSGGLFRRYPYPVDELNSNSNSPTINPKYYDKQWFDL